MNRRSGFTIVELLVVIVVIGVLAAVTIVSYSGISKQAIVASLKSDLTSSSKKLKLYYVEYGSYPTNIVNNCPTTPVSNASYCLKPSSGSVFSYTSSSPYNNFILRVSNQGHTWQITENYKPLEVVTIIGTGFAGNLGDTWGASWDENENDVEAYQTSSFNLSPYTNGTISHASLSWTYTSTSAEGDLSGRTRWVEESGIRVIETWPCNQYPNTTSTAALLTSINSHKGGTLPLKWGSSPGNAGTIDYFEEVGMSSPKIMFAWDPN